MMGIFDRIFCKKNYKVEEQPKKQPVVTAPISMSKHVDSLNNVLINMSKDGKADLTNHTAMVAFAMDYSGSMMDMYSSGDVQDVIERLLPIAIKFDDDGELQSWIFSTECRSLAPVTLSNYKDYVKNVMMRSGMGMGGTHYSPVLDEIASYYDNELGKHPNQPPAFVLFITDGDNWDVKETNKTIRKLSNYNIFIQFVGIGDDSNFRYLRHLDDLPGRKCDNTGFIAVRDMAAMSDEELYTELLRQYADWRN